MKAPDPDRDLVRALCASDPDVRRRALGLLYTRHHERVFRVAWRILGDWGLAQDVTQEVFLQAADRIRTFQGRSDLSSWLYRVAANRAIDARRRSRRRPAWRVGSGSFEDAAAPAAEDAAGEPGRSLDRQVEAARVQRALADLSAKLRAILVLRYLEGLTYEELAEVLACSIGTVKSRLSRAHAALRRALGTLPSPGEEEDEASV